MCIRDRCGMPKTTLQIRPQDLVRATRARVFDFCERKNI
jgi:prolyl-tRNA editing enzyme YbaK/EbsC (Cys-tRNA(Pro) deacylase)